MPTENMQGILPGKIFFEDQDGDIKELCTYESKEENNDDAADAVRYAIEKEKSKSVSITITRESSIHLQKMLGIERISRKRFIKLLMGCRIQRNEAEIVANAFKESEIHYTPLAVQQIIETINEEAEKEENR